MWARPGRAFVLSIYVLAAGCSTAPAARSPTPSPSASPSVRAAAGASTPSPNPSPAYPPYYIESLRTRSYAGGKLEIRDQMFRGDGFTKFHMAWPSGGQVMTGTISLPDGPGPFPVVVVNHGFIPTDRYWIGQDSGIFGDPMAARGFISVAPNYPNYAGSGPGPPDMPNIVATSITVMDLVGSLSTIPQADPSRVGMIGHSNGGGVSLIVMSVDARVKSFALYAPVSSDMRDNARKWWLRNGSQGPLGNPDENPDGYAHISPRNYLDRTHSPVLFLQGTSDEDIPAEWTQTTIAALQAKAIPARFVSFPGAHHDLVGADLGNANAAAEAWIRQGIGA
jgi:uncharacterized protein